MKEFIITYRGECKSSKLLELYIKDAVTHWGGQFEPSHPLFGIKSRQIKVTPVRRKRIKKI